MELYAGQMKEVEYNITKKRDHHGKGTTYYCDDIMCFDIEVTSSWINENGEIVLYTPGKSADYWNSLVPLSLCYVWQFSFNDRVFYGRELYDFYHLLEDIPRDLKIVIFVHNLAYEFHFLDNIFKWDINFFSFFRLWFNIFFIKKS